MKHFRKMLSLFQEIRVDQRGVAALEFALILPFMLLMFFGSTELTKGILVNRKVTIAARTMSDLLGQSTTAVSDAQAAKIFGAAIAIMGSDSAGLKSTISSIKFVAQGSSTTQFDAKTEWTLTNTGNTLRPCGVLTKDTSTALNPSPTTVPAGFYTGTGTIIVADITYTYPSPFGLNTSFYTSPSTLVFKRAYFNTPRNLTSIGYTGSAGTTCP